MFLGNYVVEENRMPPRPVHGWKYLLVNYYFIFQNCGNIYFVSLDLQLPVVWSIAMAMILITLLMASGKNH